MRVKLGDICTIQSGGTPSRSNKDYWDNGTIPWVKISDFSGKYLDYTSEKITQAGLDGSSAKVFSKGTILYTIFATLGETCILDIEAATNQAIAGLKLNDESVLLDYLYYYLLSKKDYVNEIGRGVAQNNINMKILRDMEIDIPSQEKQLKITNVLNQAANLVSLRKEQISKLDQLVKSRFLEVFGDPIVNPYHWDVATIGDIVTDVRYGTSKPAVDGGKYPYLRMNNLTYDGHLDLSDIKYIDIPDNEIEKCIVRKGDILFNRTNSIELVGKTCVFDLDDEMVIAGYIIRVRLNEKLLPIVLSSYMNSGVLKEQLRCMAKGAVNQANINAQELQGIKIYLPPMALQNQFAAFVEQIDKSKFELKQSLEKLETLKKSLMQQYFG